MTVPRLGNTSARSWLDSLPEWVATRPWLAERVARIRGASIVDPTAIFRHATQFGSQISRQLLDVAGGLASSAFTFFPWYLSRSTRRRVSGRISQSETLSVAASETH